MLSKLKQNILFVLFFALVANILFLAGISGISLLKSMPSTPSFETIECGDASGRVHKCIRIDPKAGEINDPAKGASYRVIYGQ
jgi:hypothetical protein